MNLIQEFQNLDSQAKNTCFLHSGRKGKSILAWNPIATYTGNSIVAFKKFTEKYRNCKLIGYLSYDLAYQLYEIQQTVKDNLKLPKIYFCAFKNWHENTATKLSKIKLNIESKQVFQPQITKKEYQKNFQKIQRYLREGEIYQINYTHKLETKSTIPSRQLFLKIIQTNPVNYLAYLETPEFQILSASPEKFIKIQNKKIETCPIKGTRPRGKTIKEDEKLAQELLNSKKEAAELNMITDLLRNDLAKISKAGSVKVKNLRALQKNPTVWHTYSHIRAELKTTPIEALISMFPGGSITGCPKKRAIEIIDELEPTTRGIYTGIIGHIEPKTQNLEFSIAIRTIIKKKENLYLQVGGGIVIDSECEEEYQETFQKAASFNKIFTE